MPTTPDTFYISHDRDETVQHEGVGAKPWKLSVGGEIVREFYSYDGATVFVSRAIKSHIANYYDYATSVDEVVDMLKSGAAADGAITVTK